MTEILVFDLSNLAYMGAYSLGRGVENHPEAAQEICAATAQIMRQFYRWFEPQHVVFACDSTEYYWRRQYFPEYKMQRKHTLLKQQVREAVTHFKQQNAPLCIEVTGCEADDVISVLTHHREDKVVTVVSSDMDFVQLQSERVKLFDPKGKQFRPMPKKPEYELFLKCMRGDASDNIPSAYPYVRTKILQAAFHDPSKLSTLMKTRLPDDTQVEDNYHRNRSLIDMQYLPEQYVEAIIQALDALFSQSNNQEVATCA